MNNAEIKAFNEDLDRYQAQEIASDRRAEWIEQQVEFLTSEGEEYYPFTPSHVQEAISEAKLSDIILLSSYAHVAKKFPTEHAMVYLGTFFNRVIQEYWLQLAKLRSENDYDSRW